MMDEYEIGVDLMRGRWERGPSLKALHMCYLTRVCILFLRIFEVWSYVYYGQVFMKVYFRISEIGLNFILRIYAKL